jgi:hypothetical protein
MVIPSTETEWDIVNLPQFDGHFEKGYTNLKGVSNEKEEGI